MSDVPTAYLLDASAILALLHREHGWDAVATILPGSATSAVNWSEVVQKAGSRGVDVDHLSDEFTQLGVDIIDFGLAEADAAARLWLGGQTSLSLADRACLGTAQLRGVAVVTADRAWADLDLPVSVQVIR